MMKTAWRVFRKPVRLAIKRDRVHPAVGAGELDELFSQAAKTGSIGKTRKAAYSSVEPGSERSLPGQPASYLSKAP
jgi:hypothetical protein